MIITQAQLNALRVGFKKEFQNGLGMADPMFLLIATVISSSNASEAYGWLGQFPKFREWVGDRVIKSMKEHSYTVANKDWESSVGVDRNHIEDDGLGIYSALFQEMGRATAAHPDEMVFPMLRAGFAELCYDGQNFFDTDHPVNAEVDGSGADVSVANANIDGAYTGDPWFLLDTTRAIKPLIFQRRKLPEFVFMNDSKDESVFMRKEYRYGVDSRDNVGFGFWQMAYGNMIDLTYDNLWAAYTAMRSFKADGGRPLGIRPKTLVVPISLEQKAIRLIDREKLDNGDSNELYKKFQIVTPDFL